jgi:predicted amidohydrolase YtcJ
VLFKKKLDSLEIGEQADFIILDRNPLTTLHGELAGIRVLSTWVSGERVSGERVAGKQVAGQPISGN